MSKTRVKKCTKFNVQTNDNIENCTYEWIEEKKNCISQNYTNCGSCSTVKYICFLNEYNVGIDRIKEYYERQKQELLNIPNSKFSNITQLFQGYSQGFYKNCEKRFWIERDKCLLDKIEEYLEKIKVLYEKQKEDFRNGHKPSTASSKFFFQNIKRNYPVISRYGREQIFRLKTLNIFEACEINVKNITKYESCISDEMSTVVESVIRLYKKSNAKTWQVEDFIEYVNSYKKYFIKSALIHEYVLKTGVEGEQIVEAAEEALLECGNTEDDECHLKIYNAILNSLETHSIISFSSGV